MFFTRMKNSLFFAFLPTLRVGIALSRLRPNTFQRLFLERPLDNGVEIIIGIGTLWLRTTLSFFGITHDVVENDGVSMIKFGCLINGV